MAFEHDSGTLQLGESTQINKVQIIIHHAHCLLLANNQAKESKVKVEKWCHDIYNGDIINMWLCYALLLERYCLEKSKDPAPMGMGNSGVVNFTAETILKWTIGPPSSRDNTPKHKNWVKCQMYQCWGHIIYLIKRTCTGYVGQITYGFRTVSLVHMSTSIGVLIQFSYFRTLLLPVQMLECIGR